MNHGFILVLHQAIRSSNNKKNSTETWVQMKSKYSTWEWKSLSWRKFFFSPSQGRQHFFLLFLLYINTLICIKWKRITINHCTFLPLNHTHIYPRICKFNRNALFAHFESWSLEQLHLRQLCHFLLVRHFATTQEKQEKQQENHINLAKYDQNSPIETNFQKWDLNSSLKRICKNDFCS